MPEVLILIDNRPLMNKIETKLLLTKNPTLTEEIRIFICWVRFRIAWYLLLWVLSYDSIFYLL